MQPELSKTKRDQAVQRALRDRDKALKERDKALTALKEAVDEREYILGFLTKLGFAFGASRQLSYHPLEGGAVEIRSVYPSPAEAVAVSLHIRHLRAMVAVASAKPDAALRAYQARLAGPRRGDDA